MVKHAPPAGPEPRGVGREVWIGACVGIVIFAAVVSVAVPQITAKVWQLAPTVQKQSVESVRSVPVIAMRGEAKLDEWRTFSLGAEHVGQLIEIRVVPDTKFCSNALPPGESEWANTNVGYYEPVDRYGASIPLTSYRNPHYYRVLSPFTFGYLSYLDPSKCGA